VGIGRSIDDTPHQQSAISVTEDYILFKPSHTVLPQSTFAFVPPPDSKEYVAPPEPPNPPAPAPPSIAKLDSMCAASTTLSFRCRYDLSAEYLAAGQPAAVYDAVCVFQRPNLMSLSVSQNGKQMVTVVCGPTKSYVLDIVGHRYAEFDTPPDLNSEGDAISQNLPHSVPEWNLIPLELITTFTTTFESLPGPSGATKKDVSTTLNGKPVIDAREFFDDPAIHDVYDLYIDPVTNMPLEKISATRNGRSTETYFQFQLSDSPAPASIFEFNPPANAHEVQRPL
jgi:hypothetical protein